jgi:hypothetical protein
MKRGHQRQRKVLDLEAKDLSQIPQSAIQDESLSKFLPLQSSSPVIIALET